MPLAVAVREVTVMDPVIAIFPVHLTAIAIMSVTVVKNRPTGEVKNFAFIESWSISVEYSNG